jgi:Asp-tRNA(Asn)/Glu-tRNA(Gln) amidotransferase A subunit family amidase
MTLAELAALVRAGELGPVELVDAYLGRIEALDPVLEAFNTVVAEAAREMAWGREGETWRGPLHGIPLAIKDNFYTRGVPTTANSHIFADFVPEFDATAWARLQAGGAVLLGKTQMGPLATSRATTPDGDPTTVNAWAPLDDDVSPGGSSSGSATAVAARLAASSVGTQTGGSITNPSARQGLTGLKPTMGRVSLHGIIPLTYTRDHVGPLARDVLDAALMLQTMAGPDPLDVRTQGLPPVPD